MALDVFGIMLAANISKSSCRVSVNTDHLGFIKYQLTDN